MHPALSRFSDGPDLLAYVQRAMTAGAHATTNPAPAEQIAADPRAADLLPHFGMIQREVRTHATTRHPHGHTLRVWQGENPWSHFWRDLLITVHDTVETTPAPDGHVHQCLAAERLEALWQTHRTRAFAHQAQLPTPETMPLHLAAAVASIGGIAWQPTDDGSALTRTLPNQPLRLVPRGGQCPPRGEAKKLLFDCTGWAYLPAGSRQNDEAQHALVYLSGVGNQKKLKAVWATLQDHKREAIKLPQPTRQYGGTYSTNFIPARRPDGTHIYQTFWNDEPLPESGMAHMVIQHRSLLNPRALEPFLHLTGADGTPDLALFMRQMDVASTFPLKTAWAEHIWTAGVSAKLITALPSYGCMAYWVDPSDEAGWAKIVASCVGAATATIESIGEEVPDDTPAVALVRDEHV
jgi:hypothetical protein